jgi:ABC-2 type transport system permease protein
MHILKTRLLCLFRDRVVIFWALIFPIILSTFYSLAFKNIAAGNVFGTINIAVVDNEDLDANLYKTMEEVEISENKKMFNAQKVSKDEAFKLLEDKKVTGIVEVNEGKVSLTVNNSGLYQTIAKAFLDEYLQTTAAVTNLIDISSKNPQVIIDDIMNSKDYVTYKTDNKVANAILVMYFSVIGMALIYGGFWGTENIINLQANLSTKGIRVAISPVNRFKMILIYTLAAFIVHFMIILIFLAYLNFALGVDFGDKLIYVLIVSALGSLTGITYGSFIAIALKKVSKGVKIMVTTFTGIIGGFFSGMMMVDMKYIFQTKVPVLNYINPVGVITDALHTINYFGVTSRYFLNIGILAIMVIAFTVGTFLFYRRDSYESV